MLQQTTDYRAMRRAEDAAEVHGWAFQNLRDEYARAFLAGKTQEPLRTPAWGRQQSATLLDVVSDELCAVEGNPLNDVITILAAAAQGLDVRAAALALIESMATEYAAVQCEAEAEGAL